jgi:proteasome activator subunit 4
MVKHKKQSVEYSKIKKLINENVDPIEKFKDKSDIAIDRFVSGYRLDNNWHLYDPSFINENDLNKEEDEAKWEKTIFLDKTYWGYYCWPARLTAYLNKRETYPLATLSEIDLEDIHPPSIADLYDYSEAVKPIRKRFQNDEEFLNKFISYSLIEDQRGNEKFDKKKCYLFKALFRNFGSVKIINELYARLTGLISDREPKIVERSHKLAAEMICGLIKGSKYWKLKDLKELWSQLKILFDLVVENMTNETIHLWSDCFSNAFVIKNIYKYNFFTSRLLIYAC